MLYLYETCLWFGEVNNTFSQFMSQQYVSNEKNISKTMHVLLYHSDIYFFNYLNVNVLHLIWVWFIFVYSHYIEAMGFLASMCPLLYTVYVINMTFAPMYKLLMLCTRVKL